MKSIEFDLEIEVDSDMSDITDFLIENDFKVVNAYSSPLEEESSDEEPEKGCYPTIHMVDIDGDMVVFESIRLSNLLQENGFEVVPNDAPLLKRGEVSIQIDYDPVISYPPTISLFGLDDEIFHALKKGPPNLKLLN